MSESGTDQAKAIAELLERYQRGMLSGDISGSLLEFKEICSEVGARRSKLLFAGNGASASISSHAAVDYTQYGGVPAIALTDHNLITGFAARYGYENYVARAIETYANDGDVAVLISSSGTSKNVVNAGRLCHERGVRCVSFSGFASDNPLRGLGRPGLWLDCREYNIVENTHLTWTLLVGELLAEKPRTATAAADWIESTTELATSHDNVEALREFAKVCRRVAASNAKLIFAGNGGCASIASHAATDYTKQSKVRSLAFNDHNLITCYANDYGQDQWLAKSIEAYADPDDAVVLYATRSDESEIQNAADAARSQGLDLVMLTAAGSGDSPASPADVSLVARTESFRVAEVAFSIWTFVVGDLLAAL